MSKQFWCALHCCSIPGRGYFLQGASSMLRLAAFSPLVLMVTMHGKPSPAGREEERSLHCPLAPLSGWGCCSPCLQLLPLLSLLSRYKSSSCWSRDWGMSVCHAPTASLVLVLLPGAILPGAVGWQRPPPVVLALLRVLFCVLECPWSPSFHTATERVFSHVHKKLRKVINLEGCRY